MVQILGIVNLTRDSFSDGGSFFEPAAALAHARALVRGGAAMIDLGAESTHPDSEDVPAVTEIARLAPVLEALVADGVRVSVDTWKAEVARDVIARGAAVINDVHGLRDPAMVEVLAGSEVEAIAMFSRSRGPRADRAGGREPSIDDVCEFFEAKLAELERAGVPRQRVVVDPGMGFFLSPEPQPSLAVLRDLPRLRRTGCRVCVSTSRKSFIGSVLGRDVTERGAGTLATELWAARRGADWIRTHDVRALADALGIVAAIEHGSA